MSMTFDNIQDRRKYIASGKILDTPRSLILELSYNCNLHCIMCPYREKPIDPNHFMNLELLEKIIGNHTSRGNFLNNLEEIRLNGRGESTIHPQFISILQKISDAFPNVHLTLFTNLVFPNDIILQALKDHHVEIYVSVDSADPHHFESIRMGAKFDQVIGRLKQIQQSFLVFTLQKTNYREIIDVGKLASMVDFGLIINVVHVEDSQYKIDFNKILDNDWLDIMNQFKSLHDIIPDDRLLIPDQIWGRLVPDEISTTISCDRLPICPNVTGEMMIAHDGTVFPCNMFNPTIYGNLLQQSFPEIWQSKQHEAFLTNHKQHPYCQYCEYMIPLQECKS